MNPIDAVVVIAYLLVMVGVGVWFMRRNKSSDDYFRGGGRLPWWVVSLSIYATLFSSITFLSVPALTYHTDCRYFLKQTAVLLLVPVVIRFYLPFFRKLNLTSAYEYLEVRFNLGCRLFASAAFILFMVARTAVVAYLPAVAIAAVTGLDVNLAIAVVTVITIVYCTIGGVEAVVWSDFVQSVILIGSTVAIFAYLVLGTDGGFAGFLAKGLDAGKFRMVDLGLDWSQPVLWVVLVGGLVENLASYTSDQCVVQRYMTCRDEAGAAKSIRLNGVLSFLNCFVFFVLGVALWTFYQSHADKIPVLAKQDQIFPWFIAHELPVGFSGLVLAAVAAATMSTLSANLNSAATAVTTDFYKRIIIGTARASRAAGPACASEADALRESGDRRLLLCGKITTVVVGLLGGAFALVLANMDIGSVYDQFLKFLGVLTGGLACLFLMGRFLPFVHGRAAFAGLVANYAVCLSLDFLPFAHKPHVLLYGAFGVVACLLVATLLSLRVSGTGRRLKAAILTVLAALAVHAASARGMLVVGLSDQRLEKDLATVEAPYSEAFEKAGYVPLVIPCTTNAATLAAALDRVDLLVLTGGADVEPARYGASRSAVCGAPDHLRDAFELELVAAARRRRLPIVGICRGMQLLNVAFGGTLWQDLPSEWHAATNVNHGTGSYLNPGGFPAAHVIRPVPGSRLAAEIGTADLAVNSHHHQAVKKLAPGFRIVARAPDGVVEAIEGDDYPAFGIQGHPEALVARAAGNPAYDLPRLVKLLRALPKLAAPPRRRRL